MRAALKKTFIPLLSLFIFVLGSGFFSTLLSVRLHGLGAGSFSIGLMTTFYYAGLVLGSFKIEKFILRVGHIRAFSAFASGIAVICMLHGLYFSYVFWYLLRFVNGFATAGIYVVIESWLLSVGRVNTRGLILSLYMIVFYLAQALGQMILNFGDEKTLFLFAVTSMLSSLAVIPLCLSKTPSPECAEPSTLSLIKLFQISASGLVCATGSGFVIGSLYGLLPFVILQQGNGTTDVANTMASLILGGLLLQYPVGKLSDAIERRLVLLGLNIGMALVLISILFFDATSLLRFFMFFILGGVSFSLYPVSVSLACDKLAQKDIIAGTQTILLTYSVGSSLGPLIAPLYIKALGPKGYFCYLLTFAILLSAFLSWRKSSVPPTPQEEDFQMVTRTTPVVAELDPRAPKDSS